MKLAPPTAPVLRLPPATDAQRSVSNSRDKPGHTFTLAGEARPELMRVSCPPETTRAQGRPGARCTRGLVCKIVRRNAHEHTGSAESIRPSLRNGFTAYGALSPATNSSCHRRRRIGGSAKTRLGLQNLRRLDTSNGCQDH